MSGASLPTEAVAYVNAQLSVLIPDEWGKSSDEALRLAEQSSHVLIPDEWGKSSDQE